MIFSNILILALVVRKGIYQCTNCSSNLQEHILFENEIAMIMLCNVRICISWGQMFRYAPDEFAYQITENYFEATSYAQGNISCWDQHIKVESLRFFPRYFRNSILSDTNLKLISNKDEKIFEVIYLTFITYSNVVHTSADL